LRLREIRVEAGLTASALAALMGRHHAKVSRIEHGSAAPSEADIREWCKRCGVPEQIPDLLATLRAVETMWVEWRRMEQAGLRHAQEAIWPLYQRTRHFRVYTPNLIPGVLQTRGYTAAILEAIRRRRAVPDDVEDAVAARMRRTSILQDPRHRFAVLIVESALTTVKGQDEVLSGGLEISRWADIRNPCWWSGDFRVGSGQGLHPLAGQCLLEAVRVALGGDEVGVV
jgi:transcriptional regulator with XRE-family HTH domain